MGRYNGNIQVWNGANWVDVKGIKIYKNGQWVKFGGEDEDPYLIDFNYISARFSDGRWHRVTYEKSYYNQWLYTWIYGAGPGAFDLLPASGYCRDVQTDGYGHSWQVVLHEVRKQEAVDQNLFYCGQGSYTNKGNNYVQILWLANGKLKLEVKKNGNVVSMTSTNAVTDLDTPHEMFIDCSCISPNYLLTDMWWDNVKTSANIGNGFKLSDCRTQIGDTYIVLQSYRDAFDNIHTAGWGVNGCDGNGTTYSNYKYDYDIDPSGTDGSTYANVVIVDSTYPVVVWL